MKEVKGVTCFEKDPNSSQLEVPFVNVVQFFNCSAILHRHNLRNSSTSIQISSIRKTILKPMTKLLIPGVWENIRNEVNLIGWPHCS